jgi:hypothetical protein
MKFQFLNWLELPIKNEVGDTSGIGYFKSMDEDLNFPIEIYVDNKDSLKEDSIYDLDVIFYCHGINKIAKDKEEFIKLNEPLNYEAQIPTGAFPLDDKDKDFTPSPISLMNVTVTNIVSKEEVPHEDNVVILDAKLLSLEVEIAIIAEAKEDLPKLKKNNILSGIFWAEAELL